MLDGLDQREGRIMLGPIFGGRNFDMEELHIESLWRRHLLDYTLQPPLLDHRLRTRLVIDGPDTTVPTPPSIEMFGTLNWV